MVYWITTGIYGLVAFSMKLSPAKCFSSNVVTALYWDGVSTGSFAASVLYREGTFHEKCANCLSVLVAGFVTV